VRDLGGTNGVFVAGQRVEGEATLTPASELCVAGFLRLRLDGHDAG
jgi:pSer/pThr/pTyr-binding forkhead associated (FHA) protein